MPPGWLGRAAGISKDFRALIFVLAVSLSVTVLVAVVLALLARGKQLDAALRQGSKSVAAAPKTQVIYGVGISDPAILFEAAALLLAIVLAASLLPAIRAATVDPADELHRE